MSAKIKADLWLEVLGSELKSSERIKPQSGENLKEIINSINFEGEV